MNRNISQVLLAIAFTGLFLTGCKKWEDHNALTDPTVGMDLFQQINENPNLSQFAELLRKSGYDKVIASSKTYTVFAPVNAALSAIDPAIVADETRLKMFVANHIADQLYQTTGGQMRLRMLNGKYNNLQGTMLEDANITGGNKFAKNGFLHIIDKMVPALPNVWQFLETSPVAPAKQKTYLLSLFRNVFDLTNAEQIGIDPATGRPIYKPGTDSIRTNTFWREVYDLRDESKQYTFFALADAAWDQEVQTYRPFHTTGTADSTTNLTNRTVARDLVVEGFYTSASLPDTLISKFNTKVGIDKSAIVQSVKVSNGIVHIMSRLNVRPKDKFRQIIIQGENYDSTRVDRRGNTFFRDKFNPVTQRNFRDVVVRDHGVSEFFLRYRQNDVPAIKYKAYWVAVNDSINNSTANFSQRLGIGAFNSTLLPYVAVTFKNYNEVYLGEFTLPRYNTILDIFLTAWNTGINANNSIVTADYIRLEPVL